MMTAAYKESQSEQMENAPPLLFGFENINRYWDERHHIYAAKLLPGDFYVSLHGELITTVLGSCISACIRDPATGIGGMNHFMLPMHRNIQAGKAWVDTPVSGRTRYGNIAMERLINVILASGSHKKNLEVKLFGGGNVLDINSDIGGKNIEFVIQYLKSEGLNISADDVGGNCPRKIQYFPLTGRVRVKKLNSMHNQTLKSREQKYIEKINNTNIAGKIDLF